MPALDLREIALLPVEDAEQAYRVVNELHRCICAIDHTRCSVPHEQVERALIALREAAERARRMQR